MRADCLAGVRWQQRFLAPDVRENLSPQEQQVQQSSGDAVIIQCVVAVHLRCCSSCRRGSNQRGRSSRTGNKRHCCCCAVSSQFYAEYDAALSKYMGMSDDGIGMDLTLVRCVMQSDAYAPIACTCCRTKHALPWRPPQMAHNGWCHLFSCYSVFRRC